MHRHPHPNFYRSEFACKCSCGFATVDAVTLKILVSVREKFQSPVIITSAARCPEYNAKVGGAKNSKHLEGLAVDFYVRDVMLEIVHKHVEIIMEGWGGIGFYPNQNFIHVDARTNPARW